MIERLTKTEPLTHMRESCLGSWLIRAAGFKRLRRLALQQAFRYEGGQFFSVSARRIMLDCYGVSVGDYSHGCCFEPSAFGRGTVVGRYVSIAQGVRAYQANHPMDRLSMHGFFFNHALGYVPATNVPMTRLVIEHDAWIGDGVILTPRCQRIGLGAVVGAGSIVTKDVPDYAVVAGNPAKLVRWRFSTVLQECVRNSKWWELPITEVAKHIAFMTVPLDEAASTHPLLTPR